MHTWGRITDSDGNLVWKRVETDSAGNDDMVYVTALCQELKLQKRESPFFSDRGIDAKTSIMSQIWPDYDINQIQQRYSEYFASLKITKDSTATDPTYNVYVMTNFGAIISTSVAV